LPNLLLLRRLDIGSGIIITGTSLAALVGLLCLGHWLGWDEAWSSFGVTPLHPVFLDMHGVTDPAACAAKGINPYLPSDCEPGRTFNYTPVWLWLGYLGIDGSDAAWLAIPMIICAFAVVTLLLRGRRASDGVLASLAVLSPSVLMGVERGNIDLAILALVGAGALTFKAKNLYRVFWTGALISAAILLKLYPMFCMALIARFDKRTLLLVAVLAIVGVCYLAIIFPDLNFIRQNTGTSYILSYGYKVAFLGFDFLRSEAGLSPSDLAGTWVPVVLALLILAVAVVTASLLNVRDGNILCRVPNNVAGTAYLFGSGIYCGTFLLGADFVYRLMFLVLCVPQMLDWRSEATDKIGRGLLALVLSVLWLNGNSNGNSTFLWVPQLLDWLLFFGLATILVSNFAGALKAWWRTPSVGAPQAA
jgi:hypothetical protein